MNPNTRFSIEQLNAFVDGQLDQEEHEDILRQSEQDEALQLQLEELRQLKELVMLAYADLPQVRHTNQLATGTPQRLRQVAVAVMFLFVGSLASFWYSHVGEQPGLTQFVSIEQVDPLSPRSRKIILHIGTKDRTRIDRALDAAQGWLETSRRNGLDMKIEIVAAAEGLSLVRSGTPYQPRIRDLVNANQDISFRACGFAMENRRLKEGRPFILIPEAQQVNAALEQILKRLKQGWLYVRA